jgi:hypothetical protein
MAAAAPELQAQNGNHFVAQVSAVPLSARWEVPQ